MTKKFNLIFIIYCITIALFYNSSYIFAQNYLMEHYSQNKWLNAGAAVLYYRSKNEVVIKKGILTPAWGGAILEIGTIDLSKDNYLKFDVVDLKGLYAIAVHYGGWQKYETQHIKIQEDTTMLGQQEYNISEALRMEGLDGYQQIAIKFILIDPQGEQGQGMVRLKDLSLDTK